MPIHRVEVTEYECLRCNYRWINRMNGVDGPLPERCSKCKRPNWNTTTKTPEEIGLRKRIKYLNTLYENQSSYWNYSIDWNNGVADRFLNLDPRPSISELKSVLSAPALKLNSQNQNRHRGYVLDPKNRRYMTFDKETYKKLLTMDAEKQIKIMGAIIDSRSRSP